MNFLKIHLQNKGTIRTFQKGVQMGNEIRLEKSLIEKHGKSILTAFVVAALAFGGVQYYQQYQTQQIIKASTQYDMMLSALQKQNSKEAREQGELLLTNAKNTPYAALAALMLAKLDVTENNVSAAKMHLSLDNFKTASPPLQAVARVRLARVLASEKNYEEALNLLNSDSLEGFDTLFEETKGDIFLLQNEKEKARLAYQAAVASAPQGVPLWRLQLKQIDLGVKEDS